jgi:hypothetical protein
MDQRINDLLAKVAPATKEKKLTETELEVFSILASRWQIGRENYGEGISFHQHESDKDNLVKWVDNAIEEVADQLQYLVAMKMALKSYLGDKN